MKKELGLCTRRLSLCSRASRAAGGEGDQCPGQEPDTRGRESAEVSGGSVDGGLVLKKKPTSRCARRDRVAGGWVRRRDLGRGARHEIAGNSRTDENQRSRTRLGAAAARSRVASTPNGAPGQVPKPCLGPVEGGKPARRRIVRRNRPDPHGVRARAAWKRLRRGARRRARGAHSPSC